MYNKIRSLVEEGKNLFITGGGGVGKSYTLDRLVDDFPCIDITATTGIAAVNVSGQTIHKWASVGTFKLPYGIAAKNTLKDPDKYEVIQDCKILAIDEISMLSAAQLDYLDKYFKKVRGNNKVFGGIQLLLFGDLFQLPPVKLDQVEDFAGERTLIDYCFNANIWSKLKLVPILLKEIYRQKDKQFATLLNSIREGKNVDLSLIQEREIDPPENITRLFSTNDEVKRYNNLKYNEIEEEEQIYWASDIYYKGSKGVKAWDEESNLTPNQKNLLKDFDKNCKASRCLKLKVGTRVMLLQNIDVPAGLCNGSCGYVHALHEKSVEVKFDNGIIKELKRCPFQLHFKGKKIIERKQIPLMYAYGITIHKCVHEDTLVFIKNRGYIPIKDVQPGMLIQDGQGGFNKILSKSQKLLKQGYKITTHCKYSIIAGWEHPLLINDGIKESFKKIKDININDYACLDRTKFDVEEQPLLILPEASEVHNTLKLNLSSIITEDFAWMLGALIGDGCISQVKDGRIEFISADEEILNKMEDIIVNYGMNPKRIPSKKSKAVRLLWFSKTFRQALKSWGLDYNTAAYKHIPSVIFKCKKNIISSFLRGLYDTDGHCSKTGHIVYASKSYLLIYEIKFLLLCLGIYSYVLPATNENFALCITGDAVEIFAKEVNFYNNFRKNRLQQILDKRRNIKNKTTIDIIPNFKNLRGQFKSKLDVLKTKGRKGLGIYSSAFLKSSKSIFNNKYKLFSYKHLDQLKTLHESIFKEKDPDLENIYNNHYFYDRIESIEELGLCYMYDIEVENKNSFFANGFVSHNSQGLTMDNLYIDMKRIFSPGQCYVALSRVKSLDGLYIKNFNKNKIMVDDRIVKFYKSLEKV